MSHVRDSNGLMSRNYMIGGHGVMTIELLKAILRIVQTTPYI